MGEINALHIPPFVMIGRVLTNFGKFSLYYWLPSVGDQDVVPTTNTMLNRDPVLLPREGIGYPFLTMEACIRFAKVWEQYFNAFQLFTMKLYILMAIVSTDRC
jgi:hypothetical protein